jgi:tetratricopeptide (TPR) repeat protein
MRLWSCLLSVTVSLAPALARADSATWLTHDKAGARAFAEARYAAAEKAFAAAVQEAERFGDKDPRLPASLLNLAQVYLKQGRYGRADRLCQRAQPLLEKIHGADHPNAARGLDLRAKAYGHLGLIAEAEKLGRRGLAIREKRLGKNHPDVAASVDTLAAIDRAYEEIVTERLHAVINFSLTDRSLAVREKALGKDHPDLVASLLVVARHLRGSDAETCALAEKHLRRAMQLVQKAHGDHQPLMGECLTVLASVYRKQRKYRAAEETQQKALALLRRTLGDRHPRVGVALCNLAAILFACRRDAQAESAFREALICHFSGLEDEELCHYFNHAQPPAFHFDIGPPGEDVLRHREAYLHEMVRRGGRTIRAFLERKHREVWKRRRAMKPDGSDNPPSNLEILTALRRLQKKPDPLAVIARGPARRESIFPRLPDFEVALANVDAGKKLVGFTEGGDYGNGRQDRWRFDVRDAAGKPVPVKGYFHGPLGSYDGGGLYRDANLKFGRSWNTTSHMESFIDLAPGDYTLRIQYHDHLIISGFTHLQGLIVFQSEPIRLHVQPRVIDVTKQDRDNARTWVAGIKDKDKLKVMAGAYGKDAHKFIAPESPAGKLLTLGWKAVPVLLVELENEELTPGRRAWLLSLLFSITGRNDPRDESGVLPGYSYYETGWEIWGGRDGRMTAVGVGFGSTGSVDWGEIDVGKQRRFAQRWRAFKDHIIVRER